MKTISTIILTLFLFTMPGEKVIRVACIGDSITEGMGLKWESHDAYPVVLDSLLGPGYEVLNCGRSSTTMIRDGDYPYWGRKEFSNVFTYKPDIITIKLGTNDTKPGNWNARKFEHDYQAMIDTLMTLPGPPEIYCCLPVPVYRDRWGINNSTMTEGVIPLIRKVAVSNDLRVIDLYTPMLPFSGDFPDAIHPNEEGAKEIANLIARELLKK